MGPYYSVYSFRFGAQAVDSEPCSGILMKGLSQCGTNGEMNPHRFAMVKKDGYSLQVYFLFAISFNLDTDKAGQSVGPRALLVYYRFFPRVSPTSNKL